VEQYKKMSYIKKKGYRIFKHPFIFFLIIPIIKFLILMRFNFIRILLKKMYLKTNKSFIVLEQIINNTGVVYMCYILHSYGIFYHWLIAFTISCSLGVSLFHSQHCFNPSYIVNNDTWNIVDSGLKGSSLILIPYYLKYITSGIEFHHIHHINTKIPGYNLEKYYNEIIKFDDRYNNISKLTLKDCYDNNWLCLYDEKKEKYVSFDEVD